MSPQEILHYARTKIAEGRRADADRLAVVRAEAVELEARLADAERAETALAAILAREPAAEPVPKVSPEPEAPAQPDPKSGPIPQPAPAAPPASNFQPVEPKVAAEVIATFTPATTQPKPQPEPSAGLPGPADPARDAAIQAAKGLNPSTRTERQVRILAAAGVVRAFQTQASATSARFGVHATELAPSMLRKVGIVEDDVAAVAKVLVGKKAATAKAAEAVKAPNPEPEPTTSVRDLADDLLVDLPVMLANCPAGLSAATIAGWLGCTEQQAREAAALLIRDGKAVAENKLLRLPAGEAVPA